MAKNMPVEIQHIPDNSYAICQVKAGRKFHSLRFSSLNMLQRDAAKFRDEVQGEAVRLWSEDFKDRGAVEKQLKKDGFRILPSDDPSIITVQDDAGRTADFRLEYRDHCWWVEDCDTRRLDTLVRPDAYDMVYIGAIPETSKSEPAILMDQLFLRFNTENIPDYHGRSMSVSDVILLNMDGKLSSYYVEPIGFRQVPEFLQPENYLKSAEMAMEDDYDMIDGYINNGPKKSIHEELKTYSVMIAAQDAPTPKHRTDPSDLER